MAPLSLKFVVSFSSQDERHPVENLLSGGGTKSWLSAPKHNSGQIEAVFQLEKSCVITHIDVGSVWCANIEVLVGRSSWAQGIPYKTLIATSNLMSPIDCRNSNGFVRTRMFNSSDFLEDVSTERWDRIRVVCRQPFRKDVQFGLSFLRITANVGNKPSSQSDTQTTSPNANTVTSSPVVNFKEIAAQKTTKTTPSRTRDLQNRLLKVAGSSKHGTVNEESLSRSARLVLAASGQRPKFSPIAPTHPSPKSLLLSNSVETRHRPPFKVEVKQFLSCLQLTTEDLSTITIADLRHRLEKRKRRKLTREEKKKFIDLTQDFLRAKFEKSSEDKDNTGVAKYKENSDAVNHVSTPPTRADISSDWLSNSDISMEEEPFSVSAAMVDSYEEPGESHLSPKRLEFSPGVPSHSNSRAIFVDGLTSVDISDEVVVSSVQLTRGKKSPLNTTPYRKLIKFRKTPTSPVQKMSTGDIPVPDIIVTDDLPEVLDPCSKNSNAVSSINRSTTPKNIATVPQVHMPNKPTTSNNNNAAVSPVHMPSKVGRSTAVTKNSNGRSKENKDVTLKRKMDTQRPPVVTKQRLKERDLPSRAVIMKMSSEAKKTPISETVTILCTECRKMVPEQNYLLHQVRCKRSSTSQTQSRVTPEPATQEGPKSRRKGKSQQPDQFMIPSTPTTITVGEWQSPNSPVTCPVCQQEFPMAYIDSHANLCAEITVLV